MCFRKIDIQSYTVYKKVTQSSRITLPITGVNSTFLLLKKQHSSTFKQFTVLRNIYSYPNLTCNTNCLEWKMATPEELAGREVVHSLLGKTPQEEPLRRKAFATKKR